MCVSCIYCKRACLCAHLPVSPLFHLCHFQKASSVQQQHPKWNMDDVLPQTRRGTHNHWEWQTSRQTTLSQWGRDTFARLSQAAKLTSSFQNPVLEYECCFSGFSAKRVLQSYSLLCAYSYNVVIVNPKSRGVHYKPVNLQETTVPYPVITLMSQILCSYTLSVLVWFQHLWSQKQQNYTITENDVGLSMTLNYF